AIGRFAGMARFCSSAGEGTGGLLHVEHSTWHGCSVAFVLVNLLVMGQASVTPGLTSATSTRYRPCSIRRASEHASIANLDAEYGPSPECEPAQGAAQGVPRQPHASSCARTARRSFSSQRHAPVLAGRPAWTALTDARAAARI